MRWKLAFFVFLVSVILGVVLFYNFPFGGFKLTNPLTGLFSKIWREEGKKISLIVYDYSDNLNFNFLNVSSSFRGTCLTPISFGKINMQLINRACEIEIFNPSGDVQIRENKVLRFKFTSPNFRINEMLYSGEDKVEGEIAVEGGTFAVSVNSLRLSSFRGVLKVFAFNESPSLLVNFPPCEYLEIRNFVGNVKVANSTIELTGIASGRFRCQNVENKI